MENQTNTGSQNAALKHIKTSHVLNVDIDEYLHVPDISQLLSYDYVRLNWAIAPFFQNPNLLTIPGFYDHQRKYLVKTSICKQLNEHYCVLKEQTNQYETDFHLIHYVYRSFKDLYLKCSMSNYDSYQATQPNQLLDGLKDVKKLPIKFKMAAIYQRIANASQTKFPVFYKVDLDLEETLVRHTPNFSKLDKLQYALTHYSSRIDLDKFTSHMLEHAKYRKYGRIPHHALAGIADKTLLDELHPEKWIRPTNQPPA